MAQEYWVRHQDKMTGTFSGQQLKQMAASGMILAVDMISTDQINWQVAGRVKGLFQKEQPTGDSGKTAENSPPQHAVPDSIPQRTRRTYTCPICTRRFEAVKSGAIGCRTSTPEFKIGVFTGAESTQCPACHRKVVFPMTAIRLCLYVAICFVSLTPLAFVIVRDARVDFFRPIFVGLFTFVVIRDIAMRRRSWLWFLSGASIAIASFFLAFALMPEEWYAPEERAWFNRQTWDRLDPNKTQDWGVGREVIGLTSAIVNPLDTMSAYRKVRHRDDARHAQSAAILKHLQSRSAEKYSMRSVMQQNYRGRVNREALNSRMYPNQAPKSKARAMPSWNNYKVQPNTSIKRLPASPKPVTPVSTVPNTPVSSIEKGRAYYTQGLVHSQKGEYDAAIRDYALAIEYGLMPDLLAEAYLHKSLMHYRKDDFDAAIRDCEQAVKVKPDDTNIYVFRAALHYQMRNYDKAWADVNICQKLGGAVPPDFLAALQKASGRRQ